MIHRRLARSALVGAIAASGLLLAACGNSGGVGGDSASQDNSGGPVTLNYETWYPDAATLQPAIDAFEKANPNIKVKLTVVPSLDYQKKLPLQLNGGESLDVVGIQVSAMTNNIKDKLRTVDSYSSDLEGDWKNQVNPAFVKQSQMIASDGKLYGLPMGAVSSPFMYYNNEILKKAGIKTPPATIKELAADVKKIKATQPNVTTPVAFIGDTWWQEEMLFGFAEQAHPGLSQSIIDGDASWDQPAMVEGLKAYKELFDSGAASTSVLNLTGGDADKLFYSGKAAFLFGGSWEGSIMTVGAQEANKTTSKDFGAVAAPLASYGGKPAVRALAEGGMGIPLSSKHVKEAAKFISYMVYGDGLGIWNKSLTYNPVSKVGWTPDPAVLATPAAQQGFKNMADVTATSQSIRDDQGDFLANVSGPTFLKVLRGQQSPEAAVKYLQKQWTSGRYPHTKLSSQ